MTRLCARLSLYTLPIALFSLSACSNEDSTTLGDGGGLETPDAGIVADGGTNPDPDGGEVTPDAGFETVGEVMISRTSVDFGAVVLGTTAEETVTITNPQMNPVRVSLSDPAGPDADKFTLEVDVPRDGATFLLDPGAQAVLTFTLSVDDTRSFLATVALDSCQGECPSSIVLQGEGVPTGVVCPETAGPWVANPDACIDAVVTCTNEGNATEQVSNIALGMDAAAEFTLPNVTVPVSLAPGDSLDVEVSFCPTELGERQATLLVDTDQPAMISRSVSLTGRGGGPDVLCEPLQLDLGVTAPGDTISGIVQCTNRGDEEAEIMGALTGSAEISLAASAPSPLAAGATGAFEVAFTPTDLGAEQATLTITTNDPDTPSFTVTVSAEGVDLLPCQVEAHPSSFDFGVVALGDRRSFDLRLTNAGPTSCNVSGIVSTAMPAAAFDIQIPTGVTALAPGADVIIPVQFSPTAPGAATAAVTASFSNPMSPDLVVMLSGEGGTPELAIEPFPVDFGSVAVGCASPETRTVTIRRIAAGFGAVTSVQLVNASTTAFSLTTGQLPQNLGFLDTLQVDITFTPDQVAAFSGELRVTGSGGTVSVPVTGQGQATSQRTDSVTLTRPPVDVLFVVDDSCSMGAAQSALGLSMPAFVNAFSSRGVDFHFGVVTTDMNDPAKSGRLQGTPTFVDAMTPNLLPTLSAVMQPGTTGSGTEQGIRAAVTAVTPPLAGTSNAGFLRPNADLAVVWLSDENDFSQGGITVQDYLSALRQVAGGDLILAGITGPANGNCQGPYGQGQAAPRYNEILSSNLDSLALSFCDDMQTNLLAVSGLIFGDDAVQLSSTPVIDTITVSVNGMMVPRLGANGGVNWAYDLSSNTVVIIDPAVAPTGATVTVDYNAFCLSPSCGDGNVDVGEQCDDNNNTNTDVCVNCTNAVCGDGFTLTGVEECDDGNLVETDSCTSICRNPACGDGFLQAGEECDDGNTVGGDGCPANCTFYQSSGRTSITFTEITNGTNLTFTGGGNNPNDDGNAQVILPFGVSFFGQAPTATITVSVNGLIGYGTLNPNSTAGNDNIPDSAAPNGIVAAWWENLELDTNIPGGADISWVVQGAAPNRVAIIQWRDVRVDNHSTFNHRRFTFQIHLEETTDIIRLVYGETESRNRVPTQTSASAGIEDSTGAIGYEALGCSPTCTGPATNQNGFPRQTMVTFTP